jgi:hypothetical protein
MPPRESQFIDHRQSLNIQRAVSHAEKVGHPLNTAVTLNVGHMECDLEEISAMFEKLRDNHFTKWLRDIAKRHRKPEWTPAYYVWAIEGTRGHPNIHWLVHVPNEIKSVFPQKLEKWLTRLAGPLSIGQKPIFMRDAYDPMGWALYLLKGTQPAYGPKYRIKTSPQGLVYGKRAGVSKSLGPTARARVVVTELKPDLYRREKRVVRP